MPVDYQNLSDNELKHQLNTAESMWKTAKNRPEKYNKETQEAFCNHAENLLKEALSRAMPTKNRCNYLPCEEHLKPGIDRKPSGFCKYCGNAMPAN